MRLGYARNSGAFRLSDHVWSDWLKRLTPICGECGKSANVADTQLIAGHRFCNVCVLAKNRKKPAGKRTAEHATASHNPRDSRGDSAARAGEG